MSLKNKRQRKSNVNLFFNQQINIFPEDFFSTFENKNNTNKEKSINIPHPKIINLAKLKEIQKTNSYINSRNIKKNNEEIAKNNYTNEIKLDNINNIDFSFQAPSSPEKNKKNSKNNKKNNNISMSVINKNNSFKPLFRSPLSKKIKKYDIVNKSSQSTNKKDDMRNKYNNKFKCYNIKCNELFKETKLKYLKSKNNTNISTNNLNKKEKEKEKENEKGNENEKDININLNMTSRRGEGGKTNFSNYRLSTPIIKSRTVKKLININKSKEIVLKSSSLKSFTNKKSIIETEKKIKNKSKELALKSSSTKFYNNNNSVGDTEKKIKNNKSKIMGNFNQFNKRAFSSNNYNKSNKNINNKSKINKTQNNINSKNDIKKNIKNTINNIFKDLPKECEDNPVILYKFNSLIKNMKNIQHIIRNKKNIIFNEKKSDDYKNNEFEKDF